MARRCAIALASASEQKPRSSMGNPNPKHISTSYVEQQNRTMRISMRRFTRLTNGFHRKSPITKQRLRCTS